MPGNKKKKPYKMRHVPQPVSVHPIIAITVGRAVEKQRIALREKIRKENDLIDYGSLNKG